MKFETPLRLALTLAVLSLFAVFALWALAGAPQRAVRADAALVAVDRAALADALADAPIHPMTQSEAPTRFFLISAAKCGACREVEQVLAGQEGVAVLLAPEGPKDALAAQFARDGDWAWAAACLAGAKCSSSFADGAPEIEGYAEAARLSFLRLQAVAAANGVALEPPALIWLDGADWRIRSKLGPAAARAILSGAGA